LKIKLHKIALAIIVAGAFFSCENDIEKVKEFEIREALPIQSTTNVEILYSDSAHLTIKIQAPKLDSYVGRKKYQEFVEGMKLILYNNLGEPDTQIKANYAIKFEDDERMEVMNDVVVVNRYGEKLNTEYLIWDAKSHRIFTDEFVKITTKEEVIFGDGLEANEDFTKYKILNIKGTVSLKDDFETE
jgi:LPS export ABC transporter protein LptC